MPEDEFEIYLTLLAKTLRLSDEQRDAIAAELRDHMENRLDELTEQGLPRQQAIEGALTEFGDANSLAKHFTSIKQHRNRRPLMQALFATAAAAGIATSAVLFTGTGEPANNASTHTPDAQQVAPAQILDANFAQIDDDRFALDKDLLLLAQSKTVAEHHGDNPLPLLTVYGLNLSHEVPRGVYREKTLKTFFLQHTDPYRIQVPGIHQGGAEKIDSLLAEIAEQAQAKQLLYAQLSSVYTPAATGSFHVAVTLHDEQGKQIDQAEVQIDITSQNVWMSPTTEAGHTLQNHLLVFTAVDDAKQIAEARVTIVDGELEFPEAPQENANAQADAKEQAKPWKIELETAHATRHTEMTVLANAIADLNRSMDIHRRFFEEALADPDLASPHEIIRARWKMHSLQSLRGELEKQYMRYMFSC